MYITSQGDTEPPWDYVLMKYRQKFNLTWQEAMETPLSIMQKDMEMSSIENQMLQSKEDMAEKKLKK